VVEGFQDAGAITCGNLLYPNGFNISFLAMKEIVIKLKGNKERLEAIKEKWIKH
jgi:hypothetical protein